MVKNIKYVFLYSYYKLYKWRYNTYGEEYLPKLTALLFLSLIVFSNVLSVLTTIHLFLPKNLLQLLFHSRIITGLFGISILLLCYLIIQKSGGDKVINLFENETDLVKRRMNLFVNLYFFFSILTFILVVILLIIL